MIDENQLRETHKQMIMVMGSLISGVVMMVCVFYYLMTNNSVAHSTSDLGYLRPFSFVFGIGTLIVSVFIKNMFLKGQVNAGALQKDTSLSINKLKLVTFFSVAIFEGGVLLALVVAYLGWNPSDLIFPILLGVVGFSIHFPRYDQWLQWSQNQ